MTIEEAIKKAGISPKKWARILAFAASNKGMQANGWAYVGGMRDVLWALAKEDHEIFDPMNDAIHAVPAAKKS